MTTVFLTTRREWVPVRHCDRCGQDMPEDHHCPGEAA